MNPTEYTKMFSLEDRYWWFVGRRNLALALLRAELGHGAWGKGQGPLVLDVGCGTGVVLRELGEWSTPIGLDMSPLALKFCQERGLRLLVQGDGAKTPFASGSVDAIVGLDIFEHIEDDAAALNEARRVLKPGGTVVMSVPAFKWLWGPHDVALMHFRRYTRAEVRALLKEAGFEVRRLSYSVFFLFPVVVVWRAFEKRKRGPAKASLVAIPGWANGMLIGLQALETRLIGRCSLPVGSSVVAVARKPENP